MKVGKVYLDGTKMQANGALAANRTLAHLKQEIAKMHEEMKATDAAEDAQRGKDRRGDELPPEVRGKHERLARLEQAKERLELAAAVERMEQEQKLAKRAEEEQQSGKKKPGRKPADPDAVVNQGRPELFIATASRLHEARAQRTEGSPQGRIPDDITPKQRMTRKLRMAKSRQTFCDRLFIDIFSRCTTFI